MSEAASHRIRLSAAGRTDVGRRRRHNEDSILVRPELGLYLVADGMGGHEAGDVASHVCSSTMESFFATNAAVVPTEADGELSPGALRLVSAARRANYEVHTLASTNRAQHGMGSTLVAVHFSEAEQMAHVCHVGDSRCYRIRGGQIEQLTRDHSLINDALALHPELEAEIIAELPKNVITRAVGVKESIEVEIRSEPVKEKDIFVLCSDGLSGLVTSEQLLEMSGLTGDLDELCELLVVMANDAGGPDNITVLALRVDSVRGGSVVPPPFPTGAAAAPQARPSTLACPSCGNGVGEHHRYCIACGARVVPEPAAVAAVFCHGCGAKLVPDGRFCPACGTRVA